MSRSPSESRHKQIALFAVGSRRQELRARQEVEGSKLPDLLGSGCLLPHLPPAQYHNAAILYYCQATIL